MPQQNSFLGTGWGFPVTFSKKLGCTVRMVTEEADIRESLSILFSTRPGERVMRPDYGGSLEELLFEPNNVGLETYVKDLITKAILYYEPRVDLESIRIDNQNANAGQFLVEMNIIVRATNSRFNFVFPYYLNEATIVGQ
ncbi:MAG TPA: GPW/gp25 family protein [Saprospiraceae bacterium]|nr:GPW/gp25 family protein [Saprospiraceae bacterium]HMQ82148.1 GPW/gp25 family protein [Saprospiraceae bacterium]